MKALAVHATRETSARSGGSVSLQREPPTTSDHADSIMSRTSKALTAQKTVHGTRHPNAESIPYLLALKQLFKNYQFFPVISMHIQCVYCLLLYATFITVLCILLTFLLAHYCMWERSLRRFFLQPFKLTGRGKAPFGIILCIE